MVTYRFYCPVLSLAINIEVIVNPAGTVVAAAVLENLYESLL